MSTPCLHRAFVGLGSNQGEPVAQVRTALSALDRVESTRVTGRSSLYRSAPVGYAAQPDFVNAVAQLTTALDPRRLLRHLFALEQAQGRIRRAPNGPRTLDLDLLLFDALRLDEADLIIPHPRMHQRSFVLVPLLEIAPDIEIPGRGRASKLLDSAGRHGIERLAA